MPNSYIFLITLQNDERRDMAYYKRWRQTYERFGRIFGSGKVYQQIPVLIQPAIAPTGHIHGIPDTNDDTY